MAQSEVPERLAAYRADYRARRVSEGYRGWRHLGFVTAVGLLAIYIFGRQLHEVRGAELLIVPLGYVFANLVEYMVHRHPMHRPMAPMQALYKRHATEHHRFFTQKHMDAESHRDFPAVLFPWYMIGFFLGLIATPAAFVLGRIIAPNVGWLFAMTAGAYYISYEWLHLAAHLPEDSWLGARPVARFVRHHHGIHHDPRRMRRANFNITVPLWDALLGTLDRRAEVTRDDLAQDRAD